MALIKQQYLYFSEGLSPLHYLKIPPPHTHTICDVCDHIRREQNLLIPQDGQCVVDLVCSSGLQVGDGLHLLELREWLSPDGVLSILRQHPTC